MRRNLYHHGTIENVLAPDGTRLCFLYHARTECNNDIIITSQRLLTHESR